MNEIPFSPECSIMGNTGSVFISGEKCVGPFTFAEYISNILGIRFLLINGGAGQYVLKVVDTTVYRPQDIRESIVLQMRASGVALGVVEVLQTPTETGIVMEKYDAILETHILSNIASNPQQVMMFYGKIVTDLIAQAHSAGVMVGNTNFTNIGVVGSRNVFIDFSKAHPLVNITYDYLNLVEYFFHFIYRTFGTDIFAHIAIRTILPGLPDDQFIAYDEIRAKVAHVYNPRIHPLAQCVHMPIQEPGRVISEFPCLSLPLRSIKYIIGPQSFFHFKYGERNIYLFGEVHRALDEITNVTDEMLPSNTILFSSFINSLVTENSTETYDLMVELPIIPKYGQVPTKESLDTKSQTFNMIQRQFYECLDPLLRHKCPYQNLRIHYVDYRSVDPSYEAQDETEYIRYIIALLESPKIRKAVAAIGYRHVIDQLNLFIRNSLDTNDIEESMDKEQLVMDIYGIARALRQFDGGPRGGSIQFLGTAKNVIYYAGDAHISAMCVFFSQYLNLPLVNNYVQPPKPMVKNFRGFIKLDIERTAFIGGNN